MVNDRVEVLLVKHRKTKRNHLLYVVDNALIINPTYNGLTFYDLSYRRALLRTFKLKNKKIVYLNKERRYIWFKVSLYNCVSFGQQLLGVKGIYFSCDSFFNKINR